VFTNAIWLMRGASQKIQEPVDDNKITHNNNQPQNDEDDLDNIQALPEPTGNIDDALAELDKLISQEDAVIADEPNDAATLLADNTAIDDFGAIYRIENSFDSCESIQNFINQSKIAALNKTVALAKIQADRLNTIINARIARRNKLIVQRAFCDSQMERIYQKMSLVAQGSIQKEAAAAFKTSMQDALSKRRTAIDTAQLAFQQGLDQLLAQKMSATQNATDKLQTKITSALNQALVDCRNQDVLAQIHNAINLAQAEFADTALSIKSLRADSLVDAYNTALQNASQQFNLLSEQAARAFKSSQF